MAASLINHDYHHFHSIFQDWISQLYENLEELTNHLISTNSSDNDSKLQELKLLTQKGLKHFEEYYEKRAQIAKQDHDAASFLSPVWCTPLENAFSWVGGYRPSLTVTLFYWGLDAQLTEFVQNDEGNKGKLGGLMSAQQFDMLNTLYCRIITEEGEISTRMANFQEEIADDMPLAIIANKNGAETWGECWDHLELQSLSTIIADADRLRLAVLKDSVAILPPRRAAELLAATETLHLSMHEYGNKLRDRQLSNV